MQVFLKQVMVGLGVFLGSLLWLPGSVLAEPMNGTVADVWEPSYSLGVESGGKVSEAESMLREKRKSERERVYFIIALVIPFVLAYFFPRLAVYVIGPGVLFGVFWVSFGDREFMRMLAEPGDHYVVGFIKFLAVGAVLLGFGLGAAIIAVGKARIRQLEEEGEEWR